MQTRFEGLYGWFAAGPSRDVRPRAEEIEAPKWICTFPYPLETTSGERTAGRLTLVEYGDFDCPFCAEAYPVVRALLEQFDKRLRFVFRHNPRGESHPHARVAAQAAEAAALQGQFWPMHDLLFEHTGELEEPALLSYALSLGLERSKFEADLHSPGVRSHVREDEVGGLHSGVIGTPTFFINGMHFRDKPDLATLAGAISALIESGS